LLQALGINSTPGNPVKIYFLSLAVRASAFNYPISACLFSASWAILAAYAGKKLLPAGFAKIIIRFANAFTAVATYRRPE
jgi:hypothetical protein